MPPHSAPPASSPCLLAEIEAEAAAQRLEVARWRKAERLHLLEARRKRPVAEQQAFSATMNAVLAAFLADRFGALAGKVLSGYWPIKGEPDLRPLLSRLSQEGVQIALPVVAQPKAPLVFRPWAPGALMRPGLWSIPEPATEEQVWPDIALAPVVGWTREGYRLGYGGGYFDRTLQDPARRPFTIGIGCDSAALATIFPQAHDIALDVILTETGPVA